MHRSELEACQCYEALPQAACQPSAAVAPGRERGPKSAKVLGVNTSSNQEILGTSSFLPELLLAESCLHTVPSLKEQTRLKIPSEPHSTATSPSSYAHHLKPFLCDMAIQPVQAQPHFLCINNLNLETCRVPLQKNLQKN